MNTLVLDISMSPINVTPWKRALKLCLLGKANLIEARKGNFIRSENLTLYIPSIIQILNIEFFHRLNYVRILPFNRRNVYYRDNGHCMYCNKKVSLNNFTFDHVIPRSLGGKTDWKNIVVCCPRCNRKKRNRTPRSAGLKLVCPPAIPKLNKKVASSIVKKIGLASLEEESWNGYWDVKLIS